MCVLYKYKEYIKRDVDVYIVMNCALETIKYIKL